MRPILVLTLAFGAALPLRAQDAPPEKPVTFTGDLNFVNTGGNTDLVTIGVGEKVEWKTSPSFTLKQVFSWVYGKTDGEESANQLLTGLRGEYGLSPRVSLFLGVNYDYNLFAGVKRRFEEYAGLGFLVWDAPKDKLRLDAGASIFQEWARYENQSNNFVAGRAVADYRHRFAEKAYFQQIVEFLPNFDVSDDWRLNTESALVAPLSSALGIKIGYLVRYRGVPPEGVKQTDTTFRTGIQVTY
jgi:putative salt-induced outer membrane protein